MKIVACFLFFLISHPAYAENVRKIEIRNLNRPLQLLHIPKTAGSHLGVVLSNPKSGMTKEFINLSHTALRNLPQDALKNHIPIIAWVRDPLHLVISILRFTMLQAKLIALRKDTNQPDSFDCLIPEKSGLFFPQLIKMNLNSIADLKNIVANMKCDSVTFRPEWCWPLLSYMEYFAPQNVNFLEENDDKVDMCVANALKKINFLGQTENFHEAICMLNLAFDLTLDPNLSEIKTNQTPAGEQNINLEDTDIKKFFDDLLVWEYKIYNKLLAAQRWKVAVPYVKTPGSTEDYAITQYTLPHGFDPDKYYLENNGVERCSEADIWAKRKWAMLDFVAKNPHLIVDHDAQKENDDDESSETSDFEDSDSDSEHHDDLSSDEESFEGDSDN